MNIETLLSEALRLNGSDVYIVPGSQMTVKVNGELKHVTGDRLTGSDTEALIREIYVTVGHRDFDKLMRVGDDDFSFSMPGMCRFRCNAYKQRGSLAAVLRIVPFGLPDPKDFGIPDTVIDLFSEKHGMVLVTGPAGSGKSTTLACILDRINREREGHIITIEDPLEYLHSHRRCLVSQREVLTDTESFACALRAALRQAPDVILLGEMRDFETIQTALTASETGHLLFSSLHTIGAAKTIDRIIDVFPSNQQQQVRVQLSMVLRAVVSQQLIPAKGGGLAPAFEIMRVTSAIQNMIREGKVFQIDNTIYAGASQGMRTMDSDILRLYKEGRITRDDALLYATNPDTLKNRL